MDYKKVIDRARFNYLEHKTYESGDPRYAVMNSNTKELLLKNDKGMYEILSCSKTGKPRKRLFGVTISICEELSDGVIEFVG